MEQKKQFDLKIEKNVKVKVSKNGKWLTHILPEQGLMATFSMNYYRSILKAQAEINESNLTDEEKINERLSNIMAEVNNFNSWIVKNNLDCANVVIGQISNENEHLVNREEATGLIKFVSEILNQSLDESRKKNRQPV